MMYAIPNVTSMSQITVHQGAFDLDKPREQGSAGLDQDFLLELGDQSAAKEACEPWD